MLFQTFLIYMRPFLFYFVSGKKVRFINSNRFQMKTLHLAGKIHIYYFFLNFLFVLNLMELTLVVNVLQKFIVTQSTKYHRLNLGAILMVLLQKLLTNT